MNTPKSPKFVKIWLIGVVLATMMCMSIFAQAQPMKISVVGAEIEHPCICENIDVYIRVDNVPTPPAVEKGVIGIKFILNYDPNCLELVSLERAELTQAIGNIEQWAMESNPPLDELQSTGELVIALIQDPSEPESIPPECWENEECAEEYPPNQAEIYWLPGDGDILKVTFHVIDCLEEEGDCTDLILDSVLINEGEIDVEVENGQICCGPPASDCTHTLEVTGTVYDANDQPVGAGYIVEVTNTDKPQYTETTTTNNSGTYGVGFFDPTNYVACPCNTIEVVVKDPQNNTVLGRNQEHYESGVSITIDVDLSEKKCFKMVVQSGINMCSVPLDPQEPWTLEELLTKLQSNFMFYYDGSDFVYYAGGPISVPVEGGVGYVVVRTSPDPVEIIFEGVAWENTPPPLHAAAQSSTNALQVIGTVYDENDLPVGAGYIVEVTNMDKPTYTETTTTQADGTYSVGFFDISNPVAETGDTIEVVVKDSSGVTVLGHNEEIYQSGASITINVNFPKTKFFNFTFQPGINMIGVALDPEMPWTLEDLLNETPANFLFYHDGSDFIYYAGGPTSVPVEGGVGYVAVRTEGAPADYTYAGVAWENSVCPAAPVIASGSANSPHTNVFAVVGQIQQLKHGKLDGLSLRLYNSRTKQTVSTKPMRDGSYGFVFFDLWNEDVIATGDSLTVTIEDAHRIYQSETFEIAIDTKDIQNHRVIVNPVQLYPAPTETKVLANYPNPFNPETWIPYQLSQDAHVTIRIYDLSGRLVRSFDLGRRAAGHYITPSKAFYWDGANQFGERVASGVYFYTLQADRFAATRKLFIMK
jgi:hypothetical protein